MTRLEPLLISYIQTKFGLEQSLPFDADWLHLVAGPAIFVAAALLLRRPATGLGPWLVVVGLAVFNEMIDLAGVRLNRPPTHIIYYYESIGDLLLTISIPTLMLLSSFALPSRYRALGLARRRDG